MNIDVLVAGGGIAGLLLASELAGKVSVALIEQKKTIPKHKYWLTSEETLQSAADLTDCVDDEYKVMEFIAYDDTTAQVEGRFPLWRTGKLVDRLNQVAFDRGCQIKTGARLYSISHEPNRWIRARVGKDVISCRLLVDCMGFESPLLSAKGVADLYGFFVLTGRTFELKTDIVPVGLHNPILQKEPTFLEIFPTSDGKAHVTMIRPTRNYRKTGSLVKDLSFLAKESHYSDVLGPSDGSRLFGVVPVGRLKKQSLDGILFFGESAQANPATSATGLTRMMHTFKDFSSHIVSCIEGGLFAAKEIAPPIQAMSPFNRRFQEELFRALLNYDSDRFRQLVIEMDNYDNWVVRDLIFAELDLNPRLVTQVFLDWLRRKTTVLGPAAARALLFQGLGGLRKPVK